MTLQAEFRLFRPGFALEIDVEMPGKGVTAIFGPSGSGKTTLLRAIAGLEQEVKGRLSVSGQIWQDGKVFVPTHKRRIGYVFQEASLFPHLDVRKNLEFACRRRRGRIAPEQAAEMLGIGPLLSRSPEGLSGGERQRVAIARALLADPELLLMDEPMAGLDRASRREILPWLEKLKRELDIPVLYVSHSPDEAAALADHLVLIERGKILASGPIQELMTRLDLPLAHGEDAESVIAAKVESHDIENHLTTVSFSGGRLHLPFHEIGIGANARIRILAKDVSLALDPAQRSSILNILPATIEAICEDGPGGAMVRLTAGEAGILCRITRKSVHSLGLSPGMRVHAQIKGVALLK